MLYARHCRSFVDSRARRLIRNGKRSMKRRQRMTWQERITVDPSVLVGKPVIRGTRIAVAFVIELLAEGWTYEQILANYPQLTAEDIRAALAYASERLNEEMLYPLTM